MFSKHYKIDIAGVNRSDNINLSIAANINGFESLIRHFRAVLKPDRSAILVHAYNDRPSFATPFFFPFFCIRREFWFRKQNSLFRY